MKKYLTVFTVNWQKSFEYRADFIGHMGMGIITFAVMYFIWGAIFKNQTLFNGYTFSSMMTYVLLSKFLHFVQRHNIGRMIANEIKEGGISGYLLKPLSYIKYWLAVFLADRFFEFFIRFGMLIIFFLLLPKVIAFNGIVRLILFFSFLFISLIINYISNLFIASFAFWLTDVRLFRSAIFMIIDFLAGGLIPIDIMPPVLKNLGLILPFQFTTFFPIKLYQGSLSGSQFRQGLALALFWIIFSLVLISLVWKKGLKRYEAVGQ